MPDQLFEKQFDSHNLFYSTPCPVKKSNGLAVLVANNVAFFRTQKIQEESFILKHQQEQHNGSEPKMKMEVLKTFQDALSRQVSESVYIFRTLQQTDYEMMNGKTEWHAPSLYTVRKEISHG